MSKFTTRSFLLLSGLLLTSVCSPVTSAVEINPYVADIQPQELWEVNVTDPGQITLATDAVGKFNLSARAVTFSCTSTKEDQSRSRAFIDDPLLASLGTDLLKEIQESNTSPSVEESSVTNDVLNLPIPEPSSITIWVLLGLCFGRFLIRRRVKS